MEVGSVAKALCIRDQAILAKAAEFQRKATVLLSGKLGQGENCKAGVCVELACLQAGLEVQRKDIIRVCCSTEKVYNSAFTVLQQLLGVKPKATLKELLIQYGCVRLEPAIKRVLSTYKERFLAQLQGSAKSAADFSRPVFLSASFCLVARKNKVAINKAALLSALGVCPTDFSSTSASMYDLCFDIVGVEKRKRVPKDCSAHQNEGGEDCGAGSDASAYSSSDEGMPDPDGNLSRNRTTREYKDWVSQVTSDKATTGAPAAKKKLKQATLAFGAAAAVNA